jgi:hypothetical protein
MKNKLVYKKQISFYVLRLFNLLISNMQFKNRFSVKSSKLENYLFL